MRVFDPELLRSLVAFADAGTLARAGEIVGRTPSAVTAQMQRLEEIAGVPLLEASGRGRVLTAAGERLVSHARRILAAHEEAWLELNGALAAGRIGIGVTQDFAGEALAEPLALFARTHPQMQIDVRVARSCELGDLMKQGAVDLTIAMQGMIRSDELANFTERMCWIVSRHGLVGSAEELPLAVLDAPCGFRDAAVTALERSGRRYRLAATSPSLSGLRPVLLAGLAITVRTERFLDNDLVEPSVKMKLPILPQAVFALHAKRGCSDAALRFGELIADRLAGAGS